MRVAAIIPTRNERATIDALVGNLLPFCDRVLVADDSDDDTEAVAKRAGAETFLLRGGLSIAYAGADRYVPSDWWVLHIDAGGSHQWMEALDLIDAAALDGADLTIGSRFVPGAYYNGRTWRRMMSRLGARMMNAVTGQQIRDWTSGLRVYSPRARAVLREHVFAAHGHAWQIESLWTCLMARCTVREYPITYIGGTSHLDREREAEALRLWWAIARS